MAQTASPRPADGEQATRGHWWSNKPLRALTFTTATLLLEALPIEACLLTVTASDGRGLAAVPVPLWMTLALLVLSYLLGRMLGGQSTAMAFLINTAVFAVAAFWLVSVSPGGYGGVAGNRLQAIGADLAAASPRLFHAVGLLVLVLYLWWRGYLNGRGSATSSQLLRRFTFGMLAIVLCIAATATLPMALRQLAVGALSVILPAEVYCALVALAIARIAQERARGHQAALSATAENRWLGTALMLAALVVGSALAVSVVVNYESVGALLAQLGPLGTALDTAARWITDGIAHILYFLFNGIVESLRRNATSPQTNPPPVQYCVPTPQHPCPKPTPNIVPPAWTHAVIIAAQIVTTLVVLAISIWVLRSIVARGRPRLLLEPGVEEEREELEATSLFRAQVRALLARFGRRGAPAADPLTPGMTRYVYRQVLRVAAAHDLARSRAETPDEYAARLARTAPLAVSGQHESQDLVALTDAYTSARYADREPEQGERAGVRQAAERVIRRLRGA